MIPRIGAFEISHKGVLVFSKLLMGVWPDIPGVAEKLSKMLADSNNGMSENDLRNKYQFNHRKLETE